MKYVLTLTCLIGLIGLVRVSAESLIEGRVRLDSGEPVADAQVRIFDMTDLRRGAIARAMTDGTGYFALPLAALTGSVLPTNFTLGQNYPNPFNPATIIPYQLAASSEVRLEVFNLLGQHLATLVDGERPAGFHTATWTATDAAGRAVGAGVYIYRMTVGMESQTGRMVLIDGQAGVSASGAASVWSGALGVGEPNGADAQMYGLIVQGSGLTPYMDSAFRVQAGMAPVELVVSSGHHSARKATDDDCPLCAFLGDDDWLTAPEGEEDDTLVSIPDANLRAAIAAALGKASGATITKAEMATLTSLDARDAGIRSLTGLEFAANLEWLSLRGNTITDISALSGLTGLKILSLRGNTITDISALSGLTGLEWLSLRGNTITDISALSGLTGLESLLLGGNTITDISALSGLTGLESLELWDNNLTNISALSGLTGLKILLLGGNTITDISALSGLTGLESLLLGGNTITDISALSGLTGLESLELWDNNLTNISALSGLTGLEYLLLGGNTITDVSPLRGLTNLTELWLQDNNISDVSSLSGLTNLTTLDLRINFLSSSTNDHIAALERNGTTVRFDPPFRESDFDIELVFLADFTQPQKRKIEYAARRWMSIIREDLPGYTFTQGWSGTCGNHSYAIPSGERIDDLRIYVTNFDDDDRNIAGWASPRILRDTSSLPVVGCMGLKSDLLGFGLVSTSLHEIGHVLGIGTKPSDLGFLQNLNGDTHFNGPRAIAAFNDAGGWDYTGAKVPMEKDGGHWRGPILGGELMASSGGNDIISAITIQSLADLGYVVDVTQAEPYTLPSAAAKASAKIAAPSTHAEPELSCGVGQQREPIYVVDQQGRIIRTLQR